MLEICPSLNSKWIHGTRSSVQPIDELPKMPRYTGDFDLNHNSPNTIDMKGQQVLINHNQRRKDIETASTSPGSISVNVDHPAGHAWNGTTIHGLKNAAGSFSIMTSVGGNQPWKTTQSDMVSNNCAATATTDECIETMRKRFAELHYRKSDNAEANHNNVHGDNSADKIMADIIANKGRRSSSFTGAASYTQGPMERTVSVRSGPIRTYESDTSYQDNDDGSYEEIEEYINDLKNKRQSNQKYPFDLSSPYNNKFVYKSGPLGFMAVFRDTESNELVRSNASTLPFTVFSDFKPSQQEENAIAVGTGDKVDIIARLNRWLYVRIAKSHSTQEVGKKGWIPEYALLEPEIFSRDLHHTTPNTHTR